MDYMNSENEYMDMYEQDKALKEIGIFLNKAEPLPECATYIGNDTWLGVSGTIYTYL